MKLCCNVFHYPGNLQKPNGYFTISDEKKAAVSKVSVGPSLQLRILKKLQKQAGYWLDQHLENVIHSTDERTWTVFFDCERKPTQACWEHAKSTHKDPEQESNLVPSCYEATVLTEPNYSCRLRPWQLQIYNLSEHQFSGKHRSSKCYRQWMWICELMLSNAAIWFRVSICIDVAESFEKNRLLLWLLWITVWREPCYLTA